MTKQPIDLLFLAWNRLEFTREAFATLLANTDWSLVRELVLWDDGSTDGTREWLHAQLAHAPVATRWVETRLRSPVAVFSRFVEEARAPIVAKVDNDTMLPPGWLRACHEVLEAHPTLSLLGLEALRPVGSPEGAVRGFAPARTISGLGLYRRDAFARSRPTPLGSWFGFEEWQRRQSLRAGWLDPALPVFLLDRLPFSPWKELTQRYVAEGWQRPWDAYPLTARLWSWRWPEHVVPVPAPDFDVVILSANAKNLVPCVRAVLAKEPGLEASQIIVVDDGAGDEARAQLPGVRWVEGVRPFVFARNANLGLAASGRDAVLLNDDAVLLTERGFSELGRVAREHPALGLVSAAVRGVVGNSNQRVRTVRGGLREDPRMVCFIATWLPRAVRERVGPLDERFTGYGFEDDDYSARVRQAGLRLGIFDGCVVDHSGALPSTFRTRPDHQARFDHNRRLFHEKHEPTTRDFVGVLRVKNEERHLQEVLESLLPLCSRVLVLDDHSTDRTPDLCRAFGERVELITSPFVGLDEARDKNHLLRRLVAEAPEWAVWIDGDEVLERSGPERLRDAARRAGTASAFSFVISYVWDEPTQIRVDGIYGRFRRPSMFRVRGQDPSRLHFPATGAGGNFHCGNVPRGLAGPVRELDVRLKHYGYMTDEQRRRKYEWYSRIDANNEREDRYRHLIGLPGARFAPGPPVFQRWVE